MENQDTRLKVNLNGKEITINVLDIIDAPEYSKEFIIFKIDGLADTEIFASILNEKEDSYSLDTIESEEELNYVNAKIKDLVDSTEENNNGTAE